MVGGSDEIGDVCREPRIGELALARADPGEIEAQDGDAAGGKRMRDAACSEVVLAAREAMGKQGVGARFLKRTIEHPGKAQPTRVREVKALKRHVSSEDAAQISAQPRLARESAARHCAPLFRP